MIHINNVLQPCIVCTGIVKTPGAFICEECWADFKEKSEPAANCASNENNIVCPEYDDICDDIIAEMLEDNANSISIEADVEDEGFSICKE